MFRRFIVVVFALTVLASCPVLAADAVPGDACSTTNAYMVSGGPDTAGKQYMMLCNGATWSAPIMFTSAGLVGIGTTTPAGPLTISPPATQTIGAGGTVAANGCNTLKPVTSTAARSTSTTNAFTAATESGCCMNVFNVGTFTITLKRSANFLATGGADVLLTAGSFVSVCSDGAKWYQTSALITPS